MPRPVDNRPADPPRAGERASRGGERIAKLLARAGIASRREIERMIADGRIARDGVAIDTPATLLPSLAGVTVDGNAVAAPEAARLFLYHKPVGLLVTDRDPGGRPTIYDRLPRDLPRLVPVGRLDLNTEGLLLLTTDGGLKRQLELPATGVERTYRARAYGPVSQAQLEALIEGVEIDGVRYGSIDANLERRTGANTWIELTLTEGKNREVRRVLEHLGLQVGRLIRTRYGPFLLGDLSANGIGEVRQADLEGFRKTLASKRGDAPERVQERAPLVSARLPDKGRSAVAMPANERTTRGPRRPSGPPLDPGLRRGGNTKQRPTHPHPSGATRLPHSPVGRGKGAAASGGRGEAAQDSGDPQQRRKGGGGEDDQPDIFPRPAKLQRKPGWAKPKPKTGPGRPKKPRR